MIACREMNSQTLFREQSDKSCKGGTVAEREREPHMEVKANHTAVLRLYQRNVCVSVLPHTVPELHNKKGAVVG